MDVFDQMNDPMCELDRLRDENAKLKAALVETERQRDEARDNLWALAYFVQGTAATLTTAVRTLVPGAPTPPALPVVPDQLMEDLRAPGATLAPVVNLPTRPDSTKAAAAPTATAHHNPSTHNPKGAS